MGSSKYEINVPVMDVYAGLKADADRARSERLKGTAIRQETLALHMQNAERVMQAFCPEGHRVRVALVYEWVPDVNPVLRPEHWR